ncbi:MAG: DNA polymerase I, partial [Chloroflexi bacterium]|nr:DNA polymerase I [Chloroflexota bacterium]
MAESGTMPMLEKEPRLLLVDGHALVFIAHNAIKQPLTIRSTGEIVTAVFGFLNVFFRVLNEYSPTHIAFTFDPPGPTFRHERYADYKGTRPDMPAELPAQIEKIRRLADAFRIPVYEVPGFEADDVLGTFAKQAQEQGIETIVLTVDTDILQIVSPQVRVLIDSSFQKKLYDEQAVRERYEGLGPSAVPDIKALVGDTSDNIPGVPGIGNKTAIKLVSEFGSIEGILEHIDEVTPPRAQQNLRDNRDQAIESKVLTTIVRNVPVELKLDDLEFMRFDRAEVVELLREFEFHSMVNRLPGGGDVGDSSGAASPEAATDVTVVDTDAKLASLVKAVSNKAGFAFDTETTSIVAMTAGLVGISIANTEDKAWYIPVGHKSGTQLSPNTVLDALRPVFEDENIPKVAHNANYDITILANHGIAVAGLAFDTMLASHLAGRKAIGLKAMALDVLGHEMTPISDLIGTGRKQITMAEVPIEKAAPYAGADADFTWRLYPIVKKELEEKGLTHLIPEVEMPLVHVLVRMQRNGIAIDSNRLNKMSSDLGEQLAEVQNSMFQTVGHEFNIGSPQQLSDILFKELRLPPTKRTKGGHSTDASSLDFLKEQLDAGTVEDADPKAYDVLNGILEYRQISKIKSTYVDALPGLVNAKTGRIHTSYNQTGSATGRVSSNDPNVQNIPVRTELGREVRKAFIPGKDGWTLFGADYSQIELRILAHMSQDPGLLEAFRSGEDIHSATASTVNNVPLDEVTPDMRRIAKIMNFGVVYGLSAFGIQQQTGLKADEGRAFIETYFGKYPGIRDYIEKTKAQAAQDGYVQTLLGRRRYIP